jgi:hypothetical protein
MGKLREEYEPVRKAGQSLQTGTVSVKPGSMLTLDEKSKFPL